METLEDILIPIFICVVLPVMIVWLTTRAATNADNKRAQVLMKAIESNASIDADKLAEALQKPRRTPAEMQSRRLMRGVMFTLLGIVAALVALWMSLQEAKSDPTGVLFMLIAAGICFAVGVANLTVFYVCRKSEGKAADDHK